MERFGIWIDNTEHSPHEDEWFESIEPATGQPWLKVANSTAEDVDHAVTAARQAYEPGSPWREATPSARRKMILAAAAKIQQNREALAVIESRDAGKLLRETRLHVDACVEWLEYFAGMTDKVCGQTIPTENNVLNYTMRQPYGVVGAIVPGNSPILLTMWKLAPALAAGNTIVLKPSENTTASIITLMRLWSEIFPGGVINILPGLGPNVGQMIINHPEVRKVAFTGGVAGGSSVAESAGRFLKPSLLELGGKSANIVFADAPWEKALAGVMAGVFAASGQTCMAGARVLVEESIYAEFLQELTRRTQDVIVGHPGDERTHVGPLGSLRQLEKVESLVNSARSEGATVAAGGSRVNVEGYLGGFYYSPTILTNSNLYGAINRLEIFGPVMTITPFRDEMAALDIANDSDFGLVAGLWTNNLTRSQRMARDLDVGTIFLNLYRKVMPQSPFGGRKQSGYGRENGFEVMLEYTQGKSVIMDLDDDQPQDPFLMRVGEKV